MISNCPLHNAIIDRDIETALALIAAGMYLHETDGYERGATPLHVAATTSSYYDVELKIVRSLLEHAVCVDAQDNNGDTPLHVAAGDADHVGIVKLLLKAGADVHKRNNNGKTPLHCAARADYASSETVQLLVQQGAHIEAKNNVGQTPFMAAIENAALDLNADGY